MKSAEEIRDLLEERYELIIERKARDNVRKQNRLQKQEVRS
ncbi:MAG: hypothetical protein ACOCTT_04300 [archaeon]